MTEHKLPALMSPLPPDVIAAKMATGHSVFSPSASEMTMTCAGSLVPNILAEDVQTYEAAEGTVAHALGEEWLKTGERPDKWIGYTEDVNGFEIEITEEMLGFVEDYVTRASELAADAEQWFAEQHVSTEHLTPIPGQGGTGDFIAFRWQHGIILDLKYGKEPVFAFYVDEGKVNKQLAVYASGLFREWDWLYNFQTFTLIICQPRLPHVWSEYTITREELLAFEDFARERWALAWQPDAPRTPSLKGCRWCKIRATCPALYLFMAEDLDVFENYDARDAVIEGEYTVVEMAEANNRILDEFEPSPFPKMPDPPSLSTNALAKLLRYRKFMENFFNAIQAELLNRAVSDEEDIPWWKLVESRTRRKMVDDEDHVVETLLAAGLKRHHIYKTVMLSPAEMERMLHTKLKIKLADAKRLLEPLTVKPPGQKTLAPTSDNRTALPKDSDVFINYDLEDDDI